MRAGALRKRVVIERRSVATSASGSQTYNWSRIGEAWAEIVPSGGAEKYLGGAIRDYSNHTISMRYWPGLTAKDRIVWNGRIFNIVNINNLEERNRDITITAQEGLGNG